MIEARTWRDLLGTIIMDLRERQRLADLLGINPITLTRWSTGKCIPRIDNLRPLLDALPQYRSQLSELIIQEFPDFIHCEAAIADQLPAIPSSFYAQVLHTYTSSLPQVRCTTISQLILQYMLQHLDPQQKGMAVFIAQCVASETSEQNSCRKIQSLRQTLSRVSLPWRPLINYHDHFFGAESYIGHAVITGHPVVVQSRQERQRLFPVYTQSDEESSAAFPILLTDRTAGCLCVFSSQPYYFTQATLDLIQSYANLLNLAFHTHAFYDLRLLDLGVMPPYHYQEPVIATFQQRVMRYIIQSAQQNSAIMRSTLEAYVWCEIEATLLAQTYAKSLLA